MADEVLYANVIRVERDAESDGWYACIGPSYATGLGRWAREPGRALLMLAWEMQDKGWSLDPSWTDTAGLPPSPNVIVLRRLGPADWCSWYVSGLGRVQQLTRVSRQPFVAICDFALSVKRHRYLFDADFRFPDRLGLGLGIPIPENLRG